MQSLKLSKYEQMRIKETALKINARLIGLGIPAVQESELLHILIALGLEKLLVTHQGNIAFHVNEQEQLPL